jgi:hypothetical protein
MLHSCVCVKICVGTLAGKAYTIEVDTFSDSEILDRRSLLWTDNWRVAAESVSDGRKEDNGVESETISRLRLVHEMRRCAWTSDSTTLISILLVAGFEKGYGDEVDVAPRPLSALSLFITTPNGVNRILCRVPGFFTLAEFVRCTMA